MRAKKFIHNFTQTVIVIVPAEITNRIRPALSTMWSRLTRVKKFLTRVRVQLESTRVTWVRVQALIIGSDPIRIRNELDSIQSESNSDKTNLIQIRSESEIKKMFRNVFLKIYLIKNVAKHFLFQFKRKKNRCETVF